MKARAAGPARLFLTSTLIVSLSSSLLCSAAHGDDIGASKSFHVPNTAFSPIGKVYSLGKISINGRAAGGDTPIWNGDLLEVPEGTGARVTMDFAGVVALASGTAIKLALSMSTSEAGMNHYILIISLIAGGARVILPAETRALVRAGPSAFSAIEGSAFLVEISAGSAILDVSRGSVEIESGTPKRTCSVSVAEFDPLTKRETIIAIGTIKIRKRKRKELALRHTIEEVTPPKLAGLTRSVVLVSATASSRMESIQQSSKRPGAKRQLRVELNPQGIGELISATERGQNVTLVTDNEGKAQVTFEAGSKEGSTQLTVTDITPDREPDEIRDPWTRTVTVEAGFGERHRTKFIIGGIAVAVTTILIIQESRPLKQEPPPIIP